MSINVYYLNQANSENVCDYANSEYCTLESLKVKSKNKFSLLHVNIRSLTKNLEKLEELLAGIRTLPDIIAITETRLKNAMNFGFRLQGYSIEYHDSSTNAGGVALFVKDSLSYRVENKLMVDTPSCENLWLQFDTNNSNTFVIGVVYRHPNSNYEDFRDKLHVSIVKLSAISSKYSHYQKFKTTLNFETKLTKLNSKLHKSWFILNHFLFSHKINIVIVLLMLYPPNLQYFEPKVSILWTPSVFYHFLQAPWHTVHKISAEFLGDFFHAHFFNHFRKVLSTWWMFLGNFILHISPQTLDRVEVRAVVRPIQNLDSVLSQKSLGNFRSMARSAILHEGSTVVHCHMNFQLFCQQFNVTRPFMVVPAGKKEIPATPCLEIAPQIIWLGGCFIVEIVFFSLNRVPRGRRTCLFLTTNCCSVDSSENMTLPPLCWRPVVMFHGKG